jgi:cytidylate kinase
MARTLLLPGVENRLRAQVELHRRLAQLDEERERTPQAGPFITISRQYGCMAYALAERLAQRLGVEFPEWNFTIYDRKILEVLAQRKSFTADLIDSLSARTRGVIEDWADFLIAGRPSEVQVVRHLVRTLCSVAALGEAILIGRGGAVITRKLAAGIHVRLIAPLEWRIARLRENPERAAEANAEFVKRADRERERFTRKYLGADGSDPELYHLILNNQYLSMEEQVEVITALVREKHPSRG